MSYKDDTYNLIERINKERKRQGISLRDLAEMSGYKREQMNHVAITLNHTTVPRLDTLLKIMEPLGLTLTITIKEQEE